RQTVGHEVANNKDALGIGRFFDSGCCRLDGWPRCPSGWGGLARGRGRNALLLLRLIALKEKPQDTAARSAFLSLRARDKQGRGNRKSQRQQEQAAPRAPCAEKWCFA